MTRFAGNCGLGFCGGLFVDTGVFLLLINDRCQRLRWLEWRWWVSQPKGLPHVGVLSDEVEYLIGDSHLLQRLLHGQDGHDDDDDNMQEKPCGFGNRNRCERCKLFILNARLLRDICIALECLLRCFSSRGCSPRDM